MGEDEDEDEEVGSEICGRVKRKRECREVSSQLFNIPGLRPRDC